MLSFCIFNKGVSKLQIMRKNFYGILLVLVSASIFSCTKEKEEKELDFHYLPTKDVTWKFHFQ